MIEPDLLTVREAAEELGKTQNQVYQRIHNGVLPSVAADGLDGTNAHYLIRRADLDAYKAAGQPRFSNEASDMLRIGVVSRMIGYTHETVRRLCREGVLSHTRGAGTRGHIRVHRASVEDYLAGRK